MLDYYKFRLKRLNKSNTLNIIHKFLKIKRLFSLFDKNEGSFFMNNEKNKKFWLNKCENTLMMGGRSKTTIRNYTYAISHFLNSYSDKKDISKFREKQIIDYFKKNYLNNNYKASTYNFNLAVIKYFYSICFNVTFNNNLLPKAKTPKKLPIIMSKNIFLMIINKEPNLEHKCFLALGFCCGLRACETASIKIENIYSNEHKLKVLGKGNKERFTILPDVVIKLLRFYYISKNRKDTKGYLFKGTNGCEHISACTIENYFTNYANNLGINENISYHTLRHSFATLYLVNGGDVFILKDLLGHSSLSSTSIYIHLAHDFNHLKGIDYAK